MIGEKLRKIRLSKGFSLGDVYQVTGITNSRLSKIERGLIKHPSLFDINNLLKLYDIPLLSFLCDIGYCQKNDYILKNVELLNDFELNHIQNEIDFILIEKGEKNGI